MKYLFVLAVLFCFEAKAQEKGVIDAPPSQPGPVERESALPEKQPEFPGGLPGWRNFLMAKLDAQVITEVMDRDSLLSETGFRQQIPVEFMVCEDGALCDFSIPGKDKFYPELVAEALRVMRRSPAWTPAEKDGKKVKAHYRQIITFVGEQ